MTFLRSFWTVELPVIWNTLTLICHGVTYIITHWGRVTHICVSRLTITGSDHGLSPERRQAIIWTNAGILSIGPLGTHFSENSIEILTFSFTKMRLKVSSAKWRPFCLGLNVLTHEICTLMCCAFLYCGYITSSCGLLVLIYPYSLGFNHKIAPIPCVVLKSS